MSSRFVPVFVIFSVVSNLYSDVFVISPVSQNVTLNTNPEFVCQVNGTNLTLIWKLEVAGRVIEYCNTNISVFISEREEFWNSKYFFIFNINESFIDITRINSLTITCTVMNTQHEILEGVPATLQIQGPPDKPSDFNYSYIDDNSVNITWTESDSIVLNDSSLQTEYWIQVSKREAFKTEHGTYNVIVNETVTKPFFNFTIGNDTSPCEYFVISIASQNGPPEARITGGTLQEYFYKYPAPSNMISSDVDIVATYHEKSGVFRADVSFIDASIRLCSSRCIARDTIDQQLTVLTGKYFQCSERKISFFAFKNEASNEIADRMLQFYKIYNFNISVKNSAGNWSIDGITLYISEDIISARFSLIDNIEVKIEAVYTTMSNSTGAQIMLANEDTDGKTPKEICNSGFIGNFTRKRNNKVISSFYNISPGHFTLYIIPLDYNNEFSINEENQLPTSAILMFHTEIIVEKKIGLPNFSMAQDIELQNSYLVVNKEYKEDKFLFTILNESETNIFNAKVVRYTGKKILIDGLIENKEYCISEYKYDNNNNLTGSERSSIVAKNTQSADFWTYIYIVVGIIAFGVAVVVVIIVIVLTRLLFKYLKDHNRQIYPTSHQTSIISVGEVELKEVVVKEALLGHQTSIISVGEVELKEVVPKEALLGHQTSIISVGEVELKEVVPKEAK